MSISDFIVLIRLLACFPKVYLPLGIQTAYNGRSLGLHKRLLLKRYFYRFSRLRRTQQTDRHTRTDHATSVAIGRICALHAGDAG